MFLFPNLSRVTVLVVSALGKGFGAYLVFISGDRFRQSKFFSRIIQLLWLESPWEKLNAFSERFMKSYGYLGFLIIMSVPGMPMRSSIYCVSLLGINKIQFTLGSAIGTVIRNLLVYGGYLALFKLSKI